MTTILGNDGLDYSLVGETYSISSEYSNSLNLYGNIYINVFDITSSSIIFTNYGVILGGGGAVPSGRRVCPKDLAAPRRRRYPNLRERWRGGRGRN